MYFLSVIEEARLKAEQEEKREKKKNNEKEKKEESLKSRYWIEFTLFGTKL